MPALPEPGRESHGDRRQLNLPLVLIDRWAQLAVERPWRYAAAWAIGIAAVAAAITLALLVGAIPSRSAAPGGGHDVVVPSWRN